MTERLPGITIKPDVTPKEFLERLQNLVSQQGLWKAELFEERQADNDLILQLAYTENEPEMPDDLVAQFIYYSDLDKDNIRIEMRSANWRFEVLTYNLYVSSAYLLKPLLSLYNRRYKTNRRLNIESREDLVPKLSPRAKGFFTRFISEANKSALHPYDWRRFYDFVVVSHILRSKMSEDDIAYLLVREGFDTDHARSIANVYYHGRKILKLGGNPILAQKYQDLLSRSQDL